VSGPILPKTEGILAVWRVGLVAYRDALRRECHRHKCYDAGEAAIREAYPDLPRKEASVHIVNAVVWASIHHLEWLRNGVPRREWIWPPDHRGVGRHRNPGYEDV